MNTLIITNATIVTPNGVIEKGSLKIADGLITNVSKVGLTALNIPVIDAKGSMLMPGIIDIHTDALDAEIMPRPGADMPIPVAFRELERKMSGCGFTTVYHSLHLGYEVAENFSKSKYTRGDIFEGVYRAISGETLLNNKIHLRFELSGVNAYAHCLELMDKGYVALLSVMDHTPGQGQFNKTNFIKQTVKQGKTEEQALAEFEEFNSRPKISNEQLQAMISRAQQLGIPVASHDDDTVEKVNDMYAMGVRICEFPINLETARHATTLGMHVVGGASNILRGGSLSGNANMAEAVEAGIVDTLCSDYYPPAILHAVFKLYQSGVVSLPQAVNLATLHPAKAAGIGQHTGSIENGKAADLLLVKMIDGIPVVTHTIVNGHIASQTAFKVSKNAPSIV